MEELEVTIEALCKERDDLVKYLGQLDPESDDYGKVQNKLINNAEAIVAIRKQINEIKDAKSELKLRLIMSAIEGGSKVLCVVLSVIGTKNCLDRIYGYETEALMPNNKVNMATKLLIGTKI